MTSAAILSQDRKGHLFLRTEILKRFLEQEILILCQVGKEGATGMLKVRAKTKSQKKTSRAGN